MDRSAIQGKESIMAEDTMTPSEVRPFQVDVPKEELDELRRRIAETRWPERETVADDHAARQRQDDREGLPSFRKPS
jgi:hypothetical protein